MGYSVKWVVENLGITRDMLRYYEKEELLPIDETRNPSNRYRDYCDEDIERIWCIKLLIGIGFSAKEIRAFGEGRFSFYEAISEKVEQLEKRHDEILTYLGVAKTIKMTGRVPNTTKVGALKFDDFIAYARENWNAFDNPECEKQIALVDKIIEKPTPQWNESELQSLIDFYGEIEPEELVEAQTIAGYYRVIVDLMYLGSCSEAVQIVVKCLYEHQLQGIEQNLQEKYTPLYFADHTISMFVDSSLAEVNEKCYGKDGCIFIAQAVAHFGGYDFEVQ